MKTFILFIFIIMTFNGCKDQGTNINTLEKVSYISVGFEDGFKGDSVIILSDFNNIMSSRFFSDSLNMPGGCVFMESEGFHQLDLILPLQNVHSTTYYVTKYNSKVRVVVNYNRLQKLITTSVTY